MTINTLSLLCVYITRLMMVIQRTILKAKGHEFDNVMFGLGNEKACDFF